MIDGGWEFVTPGIPDDLFRRGQGPGQVPMTKEEVRCLTIGKLRLKKDSVVYDIGAGTGSISVEAAWQAKEGRVFAVEKEEAAVKLILENSRRFGLENIAVIRGEAPEALHGLPPADRVIIGGSGGRLEEVLRAVAPRLKAGGRIVVNAVTVDTLATSLRLLEELGFQETGAVSLTVARAEKAGVARLWKGLNPVCLVLGEKSAQGRENG
ncbi:MAG: precorrin-6Y C5,15-methyltransferase (decarboxylating) subunit CbiT [Syntrophothermus sp.]